MRTKWGVVALLVGVAATAMAIGDDSASLRSDMADYQIRGASLESSRRVDGCSTCGTAQTCSTCIGASACEADAKSLASMKGNACLFIGGKVDIPFFYTDRETMADSSKSYSNTYFSGEAALYIDAKATQDAKLRLKLELADAFDGHHNDDLLEEVYFQWTNIACSGLGVTVGKKTVEFGQHKSIGYLKTLTHGRAQLYRNPADKYTGAYPGDWSPWSGQSLGLPGEVKDQFLLEASYAFGDIAKITGTLFQNTYNEAGSRPGQTRGTVGFTDSGKTRDPFLRSYAVKGEVTPFEGLNANVSFISMYDRDYKNVVGYKRNAQAISVGLDYKICALPLNVFAEYLHGWNWSHVKKNSTDTIQGGLVWGVTDSIDLGLMVEYAKLSRFPDDSRENTWSYYATAYYKMTGNMKVGLEFMWERLKDVDLGRRTNGKIRDVWALGVVTSMTF